MEVLSTVVQFILSFGAAVFMPIVMFIFGKVVGMKNEDAFIAALTLGVAFTGMNMLTGFMTGAIQPAAEGLATKTGITLPTIDTGWPAMSAIAWAWPFGVLCFPLLIVINLIMIVTNQTETLNVDLWNCWNLLFTAVLINYFCRQAGMADGLALALAFVGAGIQVVLGLKQGDAVGPTVEKLVGIPGVTVPHSMALTMAVLYPFEKIMEQIPFIENNQMDAKWLRDHLGIFGENTVMGLIIGTVLGLVAYWDGGNLFGAWVDGSFVGGTLHQALTLGIQAATAMNLFPVVSKLFMQALSPISDAVGEWMKSKVGEGRNLYIGLDWPIVAGSNELWVLTILLIPVEIILAIVLQPFGNTVLPFAGIVNICLAVPCLFLAEGNLLKMIILGIIGTPFYLLCSSSWAPACTELAKTYSPASVEGIESITWSTPECPDWRTAISHALAGNPIGIVAVIIWLGLFVLTMREFAKRNEVIKAELGR